MRAGVILPIAKGQLCWLFSISVPKSLTHAKKREAEKARKGFISSGYTPSSARQTSAMRQEGLFSLLNEAKGQTAQKHIRTSSLFSGFWLFRRPSGSHGVTHPTWEWRSPGLGASEEKQTEPMAPECVAPALDGVEPG